ITEAFKLVHDGGFRHLPIVNEKREVESLLTVRDLLFYLSNQIVAELEHEQKK
ncbi:MAG: CBS domain-containing protein, partial [Bdellovibrionales bacterium]|nr:CBS domain-containing protein [Bdellovibrionales bacterium]